MLSKKIRAVQRSASSLEAQRLRKSLPVMLSSIAFSNDFHRVCDVYGVPDHSISRAGRFDQPLTLPSRIVHQSG